MAINKQVTLTSLMVLLSASVAAAVNGQWSAWGNWTQCSATCGEGLTVRTRHCNNPAPCAGGLNCTGNPHETKICSNAPCPVCQDCSRDCGNAAALATICSRQTLAMTYCKKSCGKCPVDGQFGTWGAWSTCSASCGRGTSSRTRSCDKPAPSNGGKTCVGAKTETMSCSTRQCPSPPTAHSVVDGQWGTWSNWSSCSKSCNTGHQTRVRNCDNPYPRHGGRDCTGDSQQTQRCHLVDCRDAKCAREGGNCQDIDSHCDGQYVKEKCSTGMCCKPFPGVTYVGCYVHTPYRQLVDQRVDTRGDAPGDMTLDYCKIYCKFFHPGKFYTYLGLEHHSNCFCGYNLPPWKTHNHECDTDCDGNKHTYCGGHGKVSVYRIN